MFKARFQWLCSLFAILLMTGCATNPLVGQWQYQDQGTSIGLELVDNEECVLTLDRFLKNNLKKTCRYEPNKLGSPTGQGDSYLIFLRDADGHCDVFADFEFLHQEDMGLVTLIVDDHPFPMQKLP